MTGGGGAALHDPLVDPLVARRAVLDRRRALRDSARLFSCAVVLGIAASVLAFVLFIPWIVFGAPGFAVLPLLAAASAGAGGAVAQYVARTRGPGNGESRRRDERFLVVAGALVGSLAGLVPIWLTAWSWRAEPIVFLGAVALPWWIGVGVVLTVGAMAWSARRARIALPDDDVSRASVLMTTAGVFGAFGVVAASAAEAALPWSDPGDVCIRLGGGVLTRQVFPAQVWCWRGDQAVAVAPRAIEAVQVISIAAAAILLLAALVVALGVQRRPRVALVAGIAGGVLVVASVVVGTLVAGIEPIRAEASGAVRSQSPPTSQPTAPAADPGTGFPGEDARPPVETPSLEEARRQLATLAESTIAAVGPGATWRDPQGPVITEIPCEGGLMLQLDGEFAMGLITDTTTDEHDRAVTDDNIAAAQRIGAAWRTLGMGAPEPLHGEEHFGGGLLDAVEHAVVAFDFGVAQPRIDGRCLPLAG